MIVKLIGGAMLVAASVVGAEALNARGRRGLEFVDGWIALIRYTRRMVECYALPEADILARAAREALTACGYKREVPPADFRTVLVGACAEEIGEQVICSVRHFVAAYGEGYREEQVKICDECLQALQEERERLSDLSLTARKRNTTIAVSAAMGIGILLL